MMTVSVAAFGWLYALVRRRCGEPPALAAALLALGFLVDPFLGFGGAIVWGVVALMKLSSARQPRIDLDALAGALVVGSAAGLTLQASLEAARSSVGVRERGEVESVLRDARHLGLAAALARSKGDAAQLFDRLARAQVSGAPLAATVAGFTAEQRAASRVARIEAARRLPVRLTIPLALLVLPGFVLLTAGPAAVGSIQRMLGPLLP